MKLKKIHVTNFRSVEDSGEFEVDPVTCLVGKNEAGKSAVLLALAALNPNKATAVTLERERDYPRRNLVRYKEIHGDEEALVIRTTWELTEAEVQSIAEEVGEGVVTSRQVDVSRRYAQSAEVYIELDHSAAVEYLYKQVALDAPQRSMLGSPRTTSELIEALDELESPTEKHTQLKDYLADRGDAGSRIAECVTKMLPTFMYVSSYDRMYGAIQIEQTREWIANREIDYEEHRGERLFAEFLEYAGVPMEEIMQVSTYETFNARLQTASNNITDQILEYWSQNPDLDVEVRIEAARPGDPAPFDQGTIARARIRNNLHRVDTPFSERSSGFVWFFSFLVKFAQVKNAGGPVILLLDEPGLSLHGKAQGDLLRFIDEKLAPSHQVIYSTHSPFMVPGDKLGRVRIVEDKMDTNKTPRRALGTRVSHDALRVEPDALFPLQGALGYEAVQTLFVGKNTLLVEGPSDILYLQVLSNALSARGRSSLDPRWTMCPAGGIDRMMPFISLFAGKKLHIAVLSDAARGTKRQVDRISQSDILRAGQFFTIADFIGMDEADIEDVFDPELYAEIVNRSYELPEAHRVTVEKLKQDSSTTRVVKKVEALFRAMPDTIRMYDHYTPAAWLVRNPELLASKTEVINRTLGRAEKIVETFNYLLE